MSKAASDYKSLFQNNSFKNIHDFYVIMTSYFNAHSKALGGVVFETNFNKFLQNWDGCILSSIALQVKNHDLNEEFELFLPVHLYNVQDIDKFQKGLDYLTYNYINNSNRIYFKLVNNSIKYIPEYVFSSDEVKSLNIPDKTGFKNLTFLKIYFNNLNEYSNLRENLEEFKVHYNNCLIKEKNALEAESILSNCDSKYHKIKNSLYSINRAEQELTKTKVKLIKEELHLKEIYRQKILKSMTKTEPFKGYSLLSRGYNLDKKESKPISKIMPDGFGFFNEAQLQGVPVELEFEEQQNNVEADPQVVGEQEVPGIRWQVQAPRAAFNNEVDRLRL